MRRMRSTETTISPKHVAIAHAKMLHDVVSLDVNFWKLRECNSKDEKTLTMLNIVDATSRMHIASRNPKSDLEHAVEDIRARMAQITRGLYDQAEGGRTFADPMPVEAHWHKIQVCKSTNG